MAKQPGREELAYIQSQVLALQEQMASLQSLIAQFEAAINNLKAAADSIDAIVRGPEEVVFPLDPGFNTYVRGRPLNNDRFIVHIGLDYYAEADASTVLKIIAKMRSRLERSLQEMQERLAMLASVYEKYRQALAEAAAAVQRRTG